jgi:xanthine/CO dehydrogenase XdhC/CoxF family maturation factor
MTDLEPILALWRELESAGTGYVLATVVAVEGSSYRRPGAHMLLAQDGRRAGTVSGGCLEADVAKRAWWLTANGPTIEDFSTIEDEGERPYGSGCGGIISLLLERRETATPLLRALETAFNKRLPLAMATVLDGPSIGTRAFAGSAATEDSTANMSGIAAGSALDELAESARAGRLSMKRNVPLDDETVCVRAEWRPARPGLWIFGAGDDAKPLLMLARELGWYVAVADGRSHLATLERFPAAHEVAVMDISALPGAAFSRFDMRPTDAVVLMTHSFEQDSRVLASLLSLASPPAYIGVLGPQRRTREMLAEAARLLDMPASDDRTERWLAAIHAPTGLDLGANTPASIALSILSEILQTLHQGSALPLRVVRASKLEALHP